MKRWLPFVFLLLLATATSVHAHAPFPCFFSAAFQQTHQVRLDGSTAAYGYDGVGSLAKVSYGGGVATNLYQYDARQRLTNVLWNAGSTLLRPNGKWLQVRDANGNPTGMRLDGGHKPSTHPDPRAQVPHGHVPGVANPDGTPWLPVNQ
jgi:hypothetical protein